MIFHLIRENLRGTFRRLNNSWLFFNAKHTSNKVIYKIVNISSFQRNIFTEWVKICFGITQLSIWWRPKNDRWQ